MQNSISLETQPAPELRWDDLSPEQQRAMVELARYIVRTWAEIEEAKQAEQPDSNVA